MGGLLQFALNFHTEGANVGFPSARCQLVTWSLASEIAQWWWWVSVWMCFILLWIPLIQPLPLTLETQVDAWCLFFSPNRTDAYWKALCLSTFKAGLVLRSLCYDLQPFWNRNLPWWNCRGQPHFLLHVPWRRISGDLDRGSGSISGPILPRFVSVRGPKMRCFGEN